jgi:hypothetical protein
MLTIRKLPLGKLPLAAVLMCLAPAVYAEVGYFSIEERFLSIDYALFEVRQEPDGVDLIYLAPDALKRIGRYEGVMVDQPEVWLDPDSEYGGVKPDNAKVIADAIREGITAKLVEGGRNIVQEPGPNVLHFRMALTDLYLKKKKRRLLAYTPIGAVAKAGADLVRETMQKVDIIEMALQAELVDSLTGEVMFAAVIKRGARKDKSDDQKYVRIDFDEFRAVVAEYGTRFRCQLDNAELPEKQWIDCTDPAARAKREST